MKNYRIWPTELICGLPMNFRKNSDGLFPKCPTCLKHLYALSQSFKSQANTDTGTSYIA